jgi:hypothetical protein
MEEVKGKLEFVGRLQSKLDEREREIGRLRLEVEGLKSVLIGKQTELEYQVMAQREAQRDDEQLELELSELEAEYSSEL